MAVSWTNASDLLLLAEAIYRMKAAGLTIDLNSLR